MSIVPNITHAALVEKAAAWSRRRCAVVITEMTSASMETPDVIGWRGHCSIVVEVKVSRQDFLADAEKPFRRTGGMGLQRYYCTPTGMLGAADIPTGWGWLEWNGLTMAERVPAPIRAPEDVALLTELDILLSAIRRMGESIQSGVSVKFYRYQTTNRATLGVATADEVAP